ncbi:vWA domain-containing protein [Dyadobacter helix]|nr:VWA domain-containing protein [Dyadobacter sp. CECT 9275]
MNWNYPLGTTEYFFIFFFICLYIAYIIRTVRVARQLKTTARTLIIKLFLRMVTFALLMISLLGPSFGEADQEIKAQGKDIYLVVDLSMSMNAADVIPSRLEKVKFELSRFVENQKANRIGIIVFSNDAYVQVPLTYDADALGLFIQSLQTDLIPGSGTNLCRAAELAFNRLINGDEPDGRSKMMVLFTDGENSKDCAGALFNNLRRYGIGVYTVGVGTKAGTSIRSKNGLLKDERGKLVITKLNEDFLSGFSLNAKGGYYELSNTRNDMDPLIAEITSARGSFINARTVMVDSNKYYYFLGAALVLVLMDVLITIGTFRL